MSNRVLIFSAPSGSGKSTIVNHILGIYKDQMEFSISATSRAPRGAERDDSVRAVGSVDRGLVRVLEDGYALDVVGIDQ